ncbi:hypothetical protein NUW58_g7842 [Xylaria curta]|uniref:Uncharacterized protein n=1 Tax=Xylaria curta TaxID=42375 RepID=A0ACC1NE74_9PEZI|nr:hypothetical protein NUW58_g7842 [Xylaria curta]
MPSSAPGKRKLPSTWEGGEHEHEHDLAKETKKSRKTPKKGKNDQETAVTDEKRLRRFRAKAPASFNVIYQRATEQRFYVLNRSRCGTSECPEEKIEITGSTGNIYTVHIAQIPSCNCPHARKGNQCKHIIYVMSRVLRARLELVYQLALLSNELREIFESAPLIGIDGDSKSESQDPNRKQLEGDCPICFTPFEDAEETVYCRATCGQNMHKECFEMWAATKRQSARAAVTCPMCRSPWQDDEDVVKKIEKIGTVGADGYVNVADQLGISGMKVHTMMVLVDRKGLGALIAALGTDLGDNSSAHKVFQSIVSSTAATVRIRASS